MRGWPAWVTTYATRGAVKFRAVPDAGLAVAPGASVKIGASDAKLVP